MSKVKEKDIKNIEKIFQIVEVWHWVTQKNIKPV